jgi:hypothetical protein
MTVKMCIKPFPAPINKFSENIGEYRSFNRSLEDKHLRLIKQSGIKKRKDMPKKPPMRAVVIESANNSANNLEHSIVKLNGNRYGLRAANERISSRKDKDFIYDDDVKLASAPKVQVKNTGDNLTFIYHDESQEEEREGGIFETIPKRPVVEYKSLAPSDKTGHPVDVKNTSVAEKLQSTNKFHLNGRSEKASAGTTAFVQILLHTLSCSASCQQPSCRKMGMVLKHYHSCQEKRRKEAISRASLKNSEGNKEDNQGSNTPPPKCSLCQQFAKIVAQHSMYLCNMSPTESGCPVPMCDMMRKLRDLRKSSLEPVPMQT